MKLLLILLLICIIFLLFKLFKALKINILITILCSLIILQIILKPSVCIDYTLSGARLFFNAVFPSLFPFLVVINIIISYDGIHIYSNILGNILCKPLKLPKECSFVLIVSVLCGYPLGARYACDLYDKKIIDVKICERLLNIASNASPLFIIGAVGTSMMSNTKIGYILLLSNILSCFLMALIIPSKNSSYKIKKKSFTIPKIQQSNTNIGIVLKNSIEDSIKTTLSICGFIIVFSVITGIIKDNAILDIVFNKISIFIGVSKNFIEGLLLGMVEMTNGCYLVSSSSSNIYWKLPIISFLIAFSGLSIISQVYSFTYKYDISMKKYIKGKFLQGIISSILSIVLYCIFFQDLCRFTFNGTKMHSTSILYSIILLILIIPLLLHRIIKLFHIS